jgi:hypothetical protein
MPQPVNNAPNAAIINIAGYISKIIHDVYHEADLKPEYLSIVQSTLHRRRRHTIGCDGDHEGVVLNYTLIPSEYSDTHVMIPKTHISLYKYGFDKKDFRLLVCSATMSVTLLAFIAITVGISYQIYLLVPSERIAMIIINKWIN